MVGPLLFTIFINDLPDAVKSEVRRFSDDTIIFNTSENHKQLQEDLAALEEWEERWMMSFNPLKCEHVKFSRKRQRRSQNTYTLHNIEMSRSTSVKYLGVKLENTLRWNENSSFITSKASARLGYMRRTIPPSLPHLRDRAYKYLARPVVEYSSTVWDGGLTLTQSRNIEAIQRRAARLVHNIRCTDRTTSTTKLVEKLGWDRLSERRMRRRVGMCRALW